MRHDYAMLQRHSIQSMSDQTDYLRNGNIAAVGASVVAPEQCAIWSYPLRDGDDEEVIFNMVNALLVRIHQSGLLNEVKGHRLELVKEGIATYKQYREKIPAMTPVWPTGLSQLDDEWFSYGLRNKKEMYLAVRHGKGETVEKTIDLSHYGKVNEVTQLFPKDDRLTKYVCANDLLTVHFPQEKVVRLYKIELGE